MGFLFFVLQVLSPKYYVAENDLGLVILLFSPSTCCWDYRLESWLFSAVLGQTQGFLYPRKTLYQLNYIPRPLPLLFLVSNSCQNIWTDAGFQEWG